MNSQNITITKRDGKVEVFSTDKIKHAILKAYKATAITEEKEIIDQILSHVIDTVTTLPEITVEGVQDIVEQELMNSNTAVAKKYIIYREWRTVERDKKTDRKSVV